MINDNHYCADTYLITVQTPGVLQQGWVPNESFLYGPSRHVEQVWAKIPRFHRRLVGWAGATEPPAHNKSMRT